MYILQIINKNEVDEIMVLITGSKTDYISQNGNIFKDLGNGKYLKKKTHINKANKYVYCGITFTDGNRTRRVHRLIATAFIKNPNKLSVVGHKNNIKHDNRIENLYWTTTSENTQKAFDDGLAVNDKGIEDSQSTPVACYANNHKLVSVYGSISEAGRCIEGSSLSSISKVIDRVKKGRKGYYFKSITKEEFMCNLIKKNLKFSMPYIRKQRKKFKAISPSGEEFFSDNQKLFAGMHNLSQASISQMLFKENGGTFNNWYFKTI